MTISQKIKRYRNYILVAIFVLIPLAGNYFFDLFFSRSFIPSFLLVNFSIIFGVLSTAYIVLVFLVKFYNIDNLFLRSTSLRKAFSVILCCSILAPFVGYNACIFVANDLSYIFHMFSDRKYSEIEYRVLNKSLNVKGCRNGIELEGGRFPYSNTQKLCGTSNSFRSQISNGENIVVSGYATKYGISYEVVHEKK
jgi:hypothetical protein